MELRQKILIIAITSAASYSAGLYFGKKNVKEIEIQTVVETQIKEHVRTIIEERPNGAKITTIEKIKDTKTAERVDLKSKETPVSPKWSVWAAAGSRLDFRSEPTYTLGIERRAILGLFMGLYGRTDGELGVSLRYTF